MTSSPSGIQPYRSSARRGRVASALLVVVTVAAVLRLVAALTGLLLLHQGARGVVSQSEFDTFVAGWTASGSFYLLAAVACAVGFLAWLSRAIDNVPSLGGGQPAVSPRCAIAWWFIPFGNLGMPYEVVNDLRRRMSRGSAPRHRLLLIAWWLLFVFGDAVDAAATQFPASTVLTATRYLAVETIACGLLAGAGVLGFLVVRQIEGLAQARASLLASPLQVSEANGAAEASGALTRDGTPEPPQARNWRMRPSWVSFVGLTSVFVIYLATYVVGRSGAFGAPNAQPHEDTDLEASLPHVVLGRPLDVWSVRGRHYFVDVMGLDQTALDQMTADLAHYNLTLDQVSYALAGRSAPEDPPYLVLAFRFPGIDAGRDLGTFGIDNPDTGTWSSLTIGRKQVQKGSLGMYVQSTGLRGVPYVYDRADVRYIVITDVDAWANDALGQLP